MDDAERCDWPTGTAWTVPRTCVNPAKYGTHFIGDVTQVCGIHRRKVERWGHKTWPLPAAGSVRTVNQGEQEA